MSKTQISLENFFIFNSSFGPNEGEEEKKILLFHPEIEKNEKLKNIGYIEALIKFTGSFTLEPTSNRDVMTMKTKKFTKFFFEPEPNFWIVMTIKNPKEQKTKDNREYTEYYTDDVHNNVFSKILQRCYLNFRLFCNTFEHNMIGTDEESQVDHLRMRLDNFFMKYLVTLNLKNCDIFDLIQSIQYKAVSHLTFFKIVNLINMLISIKNLKIKKCIFLYNQEVVYSSISPDDLFIINEYMMESLFPKYFRLKSNQGLDSDRSVGGFVTENETETPQNAPKVYLYGDGKGRFECETFRMVLYNIMDVSLVMLVEDDDDAINDEFYNEIKYSIGPQLGLISKEISDNIIQIQQNVTKSQTEESAKNFIYCNHRNYRFHACFNENNTEITLSNREGKKSSQLSLSIMNLLSDLYSKDMTDELIDSERETIIKTFNDYWIVKKYFNYRSLYLIIHKNSTLIDVAEESSKLLSEIVKNVYFTN
ncbi:hypothetical protein ACKWTF_010524 [Chironomus riparius]